VVQVFQLFHLLVEVAVLTELEVNKALRVLVVLVVVL
jgi:hypothetical protein